MNEKFKESLLKFDKAKKEFEGSKLEFMVDVTTFMKDKGIPIKILFFRDTFGLDIDHNINNIGKVPFKIPLNVLSDFCNHFGCEFEKIVSHDRYIFSFDGLDMRF